MNDDLEIRTTTPESRVVLRRTEEGAAIELRPGVGDAWREEINLSGVKAILNWADDVLRGAGVATDPVQRAALVVELQELEKRLEAIGSPSGQIHEINRTPEELAYREAAKQALWRRRGEILEALWPAGVPEPEGMRS